MTNATTERMKEPASHHDSSERRATNVQEAVMQALPGAHQIELNLHDIDQLFNTMDPSPFHQKDLDHDAEEFIVSWAQEFNLKEPMDLIIHLQKFLEGHDNQRIVEDAVHNYFGYRARLNDLEFKRLMKQGRLSLLVGLSFLVICFLITELLTLRFPSAVPGFIKEGFSIVGWVAMWRPLEIYLYEWWPIRRKGQIYEKLSRIRIEVRKRP